VDAAIGRKHFMRAAVRVEKLRRKMPQAAPAKTPTCRWQCLR
jgi:hypothetical protein